MSKTVLIPGLDVSAYRMREDTYIASKDLLAWLTKVSESADVQGEIKLGIFTRAIRDTIAQVQDE